MPRAHVSPATACGRMMTLLHISRESYQGKRNNLPRKTVKVTSEYGVTYQAEPGWKV
jgi:hypothetical protein